MALELPPALRRKVGPLPLWGWLAAGAGGLVIARWLRNRHPAGAPAPLSLAAVGESMPIGLGESAVPYDVTGRAPEAALDFTTAEPLGFEPTGFFGGAQGFVSQPAAATATVSVAARGCSKPVRPAMFGGYPDAPRRFCPQGWHLAVVGPCVGKCVPNEG